MPAQRRSKSLSQNSNIFWGELISFGFERSDMKVVFFFLFIFALSSLIQTACKCVCLYFVWFGSARRTKLRESKRLDSATWKNQFHIVLWIDPVSVLQMPRNFSDFRPHIYIFIDFACIWIPLFCFDRLIFVQLSVLWWFLMWPDNS